MSDNGKSPTFPRVTQEAHCKQNNSAIYYDIHQLV